MSHPTLTHAQLDEIDDRHDMGDDGNTRVSLCSWEVSELVRLARLGLEYQKRLDTDDERNDRYFTLTGGDAFPDHFGDGGITKLDYFAAHFLMNPDCAGPRSAFAMARDMITERKRLVEEAQR